LKIRVYLYEHVTAAAAATNRKDSHSNPHKTAFE
jgi:hypothetical protein